MHLIRAARLRTVTLTALLAIGQSLAAQPAAEPSSLGQAALKQGFEAAWARQPDQRSAGLRREAGRLSIAAAERWTPEPPALEVNAKSDRYTRNNGGREYEATVAVPLWLPRERTRSQAAASAESAALEARLGAARWRLAGEVREAYWAHQRALLDVDKAQQRLQSAQQLAADVARRVKAGDLARADSHQAEASVAGAESAVAEAAVALSSAAQRWSAITGAAPAERAPAVAEANHVGRAPHPALEELQARVEVARRQRDLAGIQTRANPELTVGAARERGEFGERYSQALIVGVRIPLGTQARSQTRVATASAEQLEAELQLSLAQERLHAEIETARARLVALETAATAAERRARLTSESRGFFEKSFRLGETDLPTRLRVEVDAAEAERQAARARLERAAAVSQLNQALGALPD